MQDKITSPKPSGRRGGGALLLVSIVWQMTAAILLCMGLGWLFEEYVYPESKPWGMLGFTLFGVIASMVLVIRGVGRMKY